MNDTARSTRLVTFLTDFGHSGGGYVAACEAIIASIAPEIRVLHVAHEVGVGDVAWGALVLSRVAPLCPPCVHLAVVDPGVGTERRPIFLTTHRGDHLVGPDNGLLVPAAESLGGIEQAWLIDIEGVRQSADLGNNKVSATFHGRDVFAPTAALLATGTPADVIGVPVDHQALVRLGSPISEITASGVVAQVIEVDRFGNVGLAVNFDDCTLQSARVVVDVVGESLPEWEARVVETFGQLGSGELGVYRDSWGQLALALNGASAAQLLSVSRGSLVRIRCQDVS
jgi:S-adenosylmethionine hydrolase